MIAGAIPLPVDLLAARAGPIAEHEGGRRNAGLHERPLVGPPEQVPLGLGVALHLEAKTVRNDSRVAAEGRVVERMHRQQFERKDRAQLVEVDVGGNPGLGDGRVLDEPARAEQPFLLARHGEEQDRTAERLSMPPLGEPDQQCNIGGVVKRAVVDAVAVHRLAVTVAVEMRGEDDHLVGELRIGSGQECDDVGRSDVALTDGEVGPQVHGNREAR